MSSQGRLLRIAILMICVQGSALNRGTRPRPPAWWTDPNGWLPSYFSKMARFDSERHHSSFACAPASKPELYPRVVPRWGTCLAAWTVFRWLARRIEYRADKSGHGSTWECRPKERNELSRTDTTSQSPLREPCFRRQVRGRPRDNRYCRLCENCRSIDTSRRRHSANCRPD